jgi:hypothetical protein
VDAQKKPHREEKEMKKVMIVILMVGLVFSVTSCAMEQKKVEKEMNQPINCATAEGDLRALNKEKAHVAEQIAEGVTAIVPMSLVVGLLTGTEGTKFEVATGDYNKMIDKRMAEIKAQCNIQ